MDTTTLSTMIKIFQYLVIGILTMNGYASKINFFLKKHPTKFDSFAYMRPGRIGDLYNVGSNLESVLDSSGIYYVGILDRALYFQGKPEYVNKDTNWLKKFDSLYANKIFLNCPDSNRVLMKEYDLIHELPFNDLDKLVYNLFSNRDDVIGYHWFLTPKSKKYFKILVYEKKTRGGRRDFYTVAFGILRDTFVAELIPNY